MDNDKTKKRLKSIMDEVFAKAKTPDGSTIKPPDLDGFKKLEGLKKGQRLTFKEVNKLGEKKAPVYVIYETRDGERREAAFIAEYQSANPKKGWSFDDGLGLIYVDAEGMYGPTDEEGREIGLDYDPNPDSYFRSAYVFGVYEALTKTSQTEKLVKKAIRERVADEKTRIEADAKAKEMEENAFSNLRDYPLKYIEKKLQKAIKLLGPDKVKTDIPINVMMLGIAALGRSRWKE